MIDPVPKESVIRVLYEAENELPKSICIRDTNDIKILYQDDWVVVADKPAGLLTHPSYTGETHALTTLLSPYTLHPVSRLDRDTSGIILLAKNGYAHDQLSQQTMQKHYRALVHGKMASTSGTIDAPIRRSPNSIITREVGLDGKEARTNYRVLASYLYMDQFPLDLVDFELETGRTHQIRVHSLHLGHPLVGDSLYLGDKLNALDLAIGRQALHARQLVFRSPLASKESNIESLLADDINQILTKSVLIHKYVADDLL